MTRVSSLAASNSIMRQIMQTQERMFGLDTQVASGKTAQSYTGIAVQSEYMINMENLRSSIEVFRRNNKNERVRQDASMTALEGIEKTMKQFRKALVNYGKGGMDDEVNVRRVQNRAFEALKEMESFLNTKADGRYLFSGSRVRTEPVRLGLNTLADFQDKYNGASVTYAETRAQHVSDAHTESGADGRPHYLAFRGPDGAERRSSVEFPTAAVASQFTVGSVINITKASDPANNGAWKVLEVRGDRVFLETEAFTDSAGDMTAQAKFNDRTDGDVTAVGGFDFTEDDGGLPPRSTIRALTAGALDRLNVGQTFTVENAADPRNNGTYTVQAVNGDTVTIESKIMRDSGVNAATASFNFISSVVPGGQIVTADGGPGQDDSITLGALGSFIDGAGNPLAMGSRILLGGGGIAPTRYVVTGISADRRTIRVQNVNGGDAGLAAATLRPAALGAAAPFLRIVPSAGEISTKRYFKGDEVSRTHRIDELRSYENDLTALNPAIEKAIRAMSIIAQGKFETEGGLDKNQERARAARYLIESALDLPVEIKDEPYGAEEAGNLNMMTEQVGYNQVVLNNMENAHRRLSTVFANRVGDIENADKTETISKMLTEQRVLQASMQSFARLQQLSLSNFL